MVFIGGWRSGRRRRYPDDGGPYGPYGPYDDRYGRDPYGRRGWGGGYRSYGRGGGGGNSCLRDMFLLEGGCCLAEMLGCGPQLLLVAPSTLRRTRLRGQDVPVPGPGGRLVRYLLALIATYQREISARRRPCCRYTPTCSHYATEALEVHGLRRGGWLAARRLLRCRPSAAGGHDPVPLP